MQCNNPSTIVECAQQMVTKHTVLMALWGKETPPTESDGIAVRIGIA